MFAITDKIETAVFPTTLSQEPTQTIMPTAALWVCDACQVWWGSQNGLQPEAHYLLQLAEPNTQLFKWEDYRGWREKTATEHVCSDCGQANAYPRFSLIGRANGREA
jgi:hypothetical protein